MPFFDNTTNKNTYMYSKDSLPVSVIAIYNADGKLIPLYLSLTDLYDNVCKIKIDGVKYTKDGNDYTTYCCLYNNGRRQQQFNLTYLISKHQWFLEN